MAEKARSLGATELSDVMEEKDNNINRPLSRSSWSGSSDKARDYNDIIIPKESVTDVFKLIHDDFSK